MVACHSSLFVRLRGSNARRDAGQEQGELAAARPLYKRALAIHEKVLGPEHPDTAESLNNLAALLNVSAR